MCGLNLLLCISSNQTSCLCQKITPRSFCTRYIVSCRHISTLIIVYVGIRHRLIQTFEIRYGLGSGKLRLVSVQVYRACGIRSSNYRFQCRSVPGMLRDSKSQCTEAEFRRFLFHFRVLILSRRYCERPVTV